MKKYFILSFIVLFTIKANAQDGVHQSSKGVVFQLLSHFTGDRLKVNDVVTFQMTQKTEKDSILSRALNQAQIQPTGDLMDIFPLLTLKDSVLIKVPTDSIFKTNEQQRPSFFPKGSKLLVIIKIIKVQSLNEAIAERDKAIAEEKVLITKYQAEEAANTDKYIADHKLLLKTTLSGLKYKITKPSVKRRPLAGDTVLVNYTGRTLDGKVFDSSIAADGTKAGLQKPVDMYQPYQVVVGHGEVIPGWDEGLLLLNEGSKAIFLIPSKLGYAEKGAGDMIKPFSTLLFDIELVKVKPGKHAPAKKTTAASTPLKKPVAKKPPLKKPAVPAKKS